MRNPFKRQSRVIPVTQIQIPGTGLVVKSESYGNKVNEGAGLFAPGQQSSEFSRYVHIDTIILKRTFQFSNPVHREVVSRVGKIAKVAVYKIASALCASPKIGRAHV